MYTILSARLFIRISIPRVQTLLLCLPSCQSGDLVDSLSQEHTHYYYLYHLKVKWFIRISIPSFQTSLLIVPSCQSNDLLESLSQEFTHYYNVYNSISQMVYSNLYPKSSHITIMCTIISVKRFIRISISRVHTLLLCVRSCQLSVYSNLYLKNSHITIMCTRIPAR